MKSGTRLAYFKLFFGGMGVASTAVGLESGIYQSFSKVKSADGRAVGAPFRDPRGKSRCALSLFLGSLGYLLEHIIMYMPCCLVSIFPVCAVDESFTCTAGSFQGEGAWRAFKGGLGGEYSWVGWVVCDWCSGPGLEGRGALESGGLRSARLAH